MAKTKKPTVTRSVRFHQDVSDLLSQFADDQMLSANAAVNKLIKERLTELGYQSEVKI